MKLSKETLSILKNFSSINGNIVFRPGNVISTYSVERNFIARAEIAEEFPATAGIYDLTRFLSVVGLMNEPEIEFGEKAFRISENGREISYTYANEHMLTVPGSNVSVKMPSEDASFALSANEFDTLIRAASSMRLPHIRIKSIEGGIEMSAYNMDDLTGDTYKTVLEGSGEVDVSVDLTYMKMISRDFDVTVAKNKIIQFHASDVDYWIAKKATN